MFLLFVDILSISMNYFGLSGYHLGDCGAGAGTTCCESCQVSLLSASSSRMSGSSESLSFGTFIDGSICLNWLMLQVIFPDSCYHSSFYLNNFVG